MDHLFKIIKYGPKKEKEKKKKKDEKKKQKKNWPVGAGRQFQVFSLKTSDRPMDIKLIRSYRSLCLHRRCLHLFTRLAHFVRSFFRCPVSVTITKINRPDTRRKSKTFSFVSKQKKKKTTVK